MVCWRRLLISKNTNSLMCGFLFFISFTLCFSLCASGAAAFPLAKASLRSFPIINPEQATQNEDFIVFFVEFQDIKPSNQDFSYFQRMMSSQESGYPSVYNYFNEISSGKFKPRFHIVEKWYTSTHNMEYYGADSVYSESSCDFSDVDGANACTNDLLEEVIEQAKAESFPFEAYSHNGQLHIILVHAGENQAKTSLLHGTRQSLLHTKWQFLDKPVALQGDIEVKSYTIISGQDGIAAISHEIGHELGLPELYDPDRTSDGIGTWGLMGLQDDLDNPPRMCAWSRAFLGWQEPIIIEKSGTYEFKSKEIYKIPVNENEYFLIENRQKQGFDVNLPNDGLLIWHADDSVQNLGNPLFVNQNEDRKRVDLEEAHDLNQNLDTWNDANLANKKNHGEPEDAWYFEPQRERCKGLSSLRLFPRCHHSEFTPFTNPNSNSNAGTSTGISITSISASASVMTAAVVINENQIELPKETEIPEIKLSSLITPLLVLDPKSLLNTENGSFSAYSAAFLIFIVDVVIFVAVTNRKGGEKK